VHVLDAFARELEFDADGGHGEIMTQLLPTNLLSNGDSLAVQSMMLKQGDKLPDLFLHTRTYPIGPHWWRTEAYLYHGK